MLEIILIVMAASAILGAFVAGQKNRSVAEGLFLGLLVGPFGVLVEGLLPPGKNTPRGDYRRPAVTVDEANTGAKRREDGRLVRECPFCAEDILIGSLICRFCGREVGPMPDPPAPEPQQPADELATRLRWLDQHTPGGAWTTTVLHILSDHPGLEHKKLCHLNEDTPLQFKKRVHQLRELGLVEPKGSGYAVTVEGYRVLNRSLMERLP